MSQPSLHIRPPKSKDEEGRFTHSPLYPATRKWTSLPVPRPDLALGVNTSGATRSGSGRADQERRPQLRRAPPICRRGAAPGADRRWRQHGKLRARGLRSRRAAPSRLAHLRHTPQLYCAPQAVPRTGGNQPAQPSLRRRQRPTHSGRRVLNYLPRYVARTPLPTQSFLQTKGFSALALLTAAARSLSVHCGVLSGTPALYPPDASSSSSPSRDNQKCRCPMSPRTELPPTESTALFVKI